MNGLPFLFPPSADSHPIAIFFLSMTIHNPSQIGLILDMKKAVM
jgi:hypothetical protein